MMLEAISNTLIQTDFGQFIYNQNLAFLAPELVISLTLLMTFALSLAKTQVDQAKSWGIALLGSVVALVSIVMHYQLFYTGQASASQSVMFGMFEADLLSVVSRFILTLGFILILHLSKRYVETRLPSQTGEFYTLLLTAFLGALLLCGANDMIMAFVALETLGISSYILTGYLRNNLKSTEASLKYLVYGGCSSAVLLFGLALIYGLAGGSTSFAVLPQALSQASDLGAWASLAIVMILAGIGFKVSAAPFHTWTPDVYEGSPTPITAFLSVISKLAAFVFAIRLLTPFAGLGNENVALLIGLLAVLSMIVGNVAALKQTIIKRLLGYSTIAHAGYMLVGLAALTQNSLGALLFYLATYVFMNTGAFASAMIGDELLASEEISAYSGLIKAKPWFVFAFSIFLLGLAGIPITAGFFAKFFLFQSVVLSDLGNLGVIIIALLASTVSLYYYLNIIKVMVIGEPSEQVKRLIGEGKDSTWNLSKTLTLATVICLIFTLGLGIFGQSGLLISESAMSDHGATVTQNLR
ncbi:MAG: NADH-quinone oxidoreductase subunit N [Vampirovibrionales bacterium]